MEILHPSVDKQFRLGIGQMPRGAEKQFRGRGWVERAGYFPGQNTAREVVDNRMKIGAASIEKTDQRRVDMPNFVGARGTNADFRFGGVNAFAWSSPAVNPDQPLPGRRRGEDLAQPLCKESQRSCRHMTVVVRCDHFLNRLDLVWCQLVRR